MQKARALIHAWLVLDFFGDARRSGSSGSSLTTTIFTQAFLALAFAALLFPETPRVPFVAANLCLSSLLIAVGLLGNQDQLNRRRADETLLAAAPVGRSVLVLARAGHAAFYVTLLTIGMALPPAVLLAFSTGNVMQAVGYVVSACACSGLAAGALGVFQRILLRALGHARAALVAASVKAMLLGGGLALFGLGMQRLGKTADALPFGRMGAEMLPPYHAARLLADPAAETWRLAAMAAAAVVLFLVALAFGDERSPRRPRVARFDPLRSLLRSFAGRGPTLGIAEFVAVSMWRSPGFRARVLPLLGLPAGMVFLALQDGGQRREYVFACFLLQLPAIYLPFVIAFLPRADQSDAGWVFEQSPLLTLRLVQDATWRAIVSHVLLPVHALAFALLFAARPTADTAAICVFSAAIAVLAARLMVRILTTVPFSQSRDADAGTDLGTLFGAALVLGSLGTAFGAALSQSSRWVVAVAAAAMAAATLLRRPAAERGQPLPSQPEVDARTPESTGRARDRAQRLVAKQASLRGELRSIGVLYVALCVLPILLGTFVAS